MSVHHNIIPNYIQQNATFLDLFIFTDALHVSVGSSAHHQEHTAVHISPSPPSSPPPSSFSSPLLFLLRAELPLVERFGLLNDLFPFPSILDAGYPVLDLKLANVLFDNCTYSFRYCQPILLLAALPR